MDVSSTLGFELLGGFLASLFYGVTLVQTFIYSQKYRNDPGWLRGFVGGVFVLDTVQICLVWYEIYWYIIKNFGNPAAIADVIPALTVSLMVADMLMLLVPLFFTHRIFILSGRNYVLALPAALSILGSYTLALYFRIQAFLTPSYPLLAPYTPIVDTSFTLLIFANLYYTSTLCVLLYCAQPSEGAKGLVRGIMRYAVESSAICCIVGAVGFGFYVGQPRTYVSLLAFIPLSKLYVNSMLATLNARKSFQAAINSNSASIHIDSLAFVARPSRESGLSVTNSISKAEWGRWQILKPLPSWSQSSGSIGMDEKIPV